MPVVVSGSTQILVLRTAGSVRLLMPLSLNILDPLQERAPTSLQVTVGGADPRERLRFLIDGDEVYTESADGEGFLGQTSIPVDSEYGAGTHTLTVEGEVHGDDAEDFTLTLDAPLFPVEQNADVDPVYIDGSQGRWVLQDVMPGGLGSWIMPINPRSQTPPHVSKTVSTEHTVARDGHYTVVRGDDRAVDWTLEGYAPDAAYQQRLQDYAELERTFYIIDHRGRAWKVALQTYKFEERRRQNDTTSSSNDEAGDWTITAQILDQRWITPV